MPPFASLKCIYLLTLLGSTICRCWKLAIFPHLLLLLKEFILVLFHTCHILLELDSRKCVWETRRAAEEEERHLAQENAQKSLDIFNLCMLVKAPTFVSRLFFLRHFFYSGGDMTLQILIFYSSMLQALCWQQQQPSWKSLFMIAFLFVVTNKSIKREKPRSRNVTKKGKRKRLARKYWKMSLHSCC